MKKKDHLNHQVTGSQGDQQLKGADLLQAQKQMQALMGNTQLPAVLYKGQTIPRRTLSDFSYLTR